MTTRVMQAPRGPLFARANTYTEQLEEDTLSDVDSRVLQSMLQDSKLDLDTEEDIKKLLERGTANTAKKNPEAKAEESDTQFSSSVFKTFSDTKLWKKVTAQASDLAESVGIWVTNRIEQDVKVLTALGVFTWDRVVQDVARALPAASTSARKFLILTNSSSYQEPLEPERSVLEEMNRPADEIQAVSRAVFAILAGDQASGRGLRTVAPAGSINSAERQRRAFVQRKKLDKQDRDVTRVAGAVVDTAYELQRELAAEANPAGYKTISIRNAIEAGVSNTGNILRGVKELVRLGAADRNEQMLLTANPIEVTGAGLDRTEILIKLQMERSNIAARLQQCIKDPGRTWLRQEITGDEFLCFDEGMLRDVVTMMIFVRDEVETKFEEENEGTLENIIHQLSSVRNSVEDIHSRIAEAASWKVAEAFRNEIFAILVDSAEQPLILRLVELEESINPPPESLFSNTAPTGATMAHGVSAKASENQPWFAMTDPYQGEQVVVEPIQSGNVKRPTFVDVIPEIVATRPMEPSSHDVVEVKSTASENFDVTVLDDEKESQGYTFAAELVTDDDFDVAVGRAKSVKALTEEEMEEKTEQPSLVSMFLLRSLDVVFFLVEKTLTVGVPKAIALSKTISIRIDEINRDGRGTKGWQQFRKSASPRGRY
jgi:hypothetical protein